jgi:hypothetical protein
MLLKSHGELFYIGNVFRGLVVLAGLFFLISCNNSPNETDIWQEAEDKNTIEAYDAYLLKFPESENATKARTEIARILFAQAKEGNPIESYDEYVKRFPDGKNKSAFEPLVYEYILTQDSAQLMEEYYKRFPEGEYHSGNEAAVFENLTTGISNLTFTGFLERFPQTDYKPIIDSLLYDSAVSHTNPELFDEYIRLFPNGSHKKVLDSIFEANLYKTALQKGTRKSFNEYLDRFGRSERTSLIKINSVPSKQTIQLVDKNDSIWKSLTTPVSVRAIVGTSFKTVIENPDYKKDVYQYTVTDESNQSIERKLKVPSVTIVDEDFSDAGTKWAFSTNNNKSEVIGDKLRCAVKSNQFQKIENLNMDLNKNFEIEIEFQIEKEISPYRRTYCGIVWGEETKVKYYFISNQGRYNYGSQTQIVSQENPYGYSGWEGYNAQSDVWIKSDNYNENGFNTLKIIKIGNQIKYFINDKYVHFENDLTKFRKSWLGYGLGNGQVLINSFRIEQYTE